MTLSNNNLDYQKKELEKERKNLNYGLNLLKQ